MNIQTVNQLITVFKDAANRHYQINGFGYGDNWEVGASEAKMHPVLWINPVSATMAESENNIGYKTFEIDFEIRVFDLVNKDESNENEVLSDSVDILKDIITEFKEHPYYTNSKLNIVNDIEFEPFTEEFDEEVTGWVCEISFKSPLLNSWCGLPMAEIDGFSFPDAACDGYNAVCDATYVEDIIGIYPIEVTQASGNTKIISIDTSSLTGDTYVTGGTFNNTTNNLELTRNDGVTVLTDLSQLKDDTNTYTTGATLNGNIVAFDTNASLSAYTLDLSSLEDIKLTGVTWDNNSTLTHTLNDGTIINTTINTFSGLTVNGSISATTISGGTFYGDGSNLTGIDTSNIYNTDGSLTGNRLLNMGLNQNLSIVGLNSNFIVGNTTTLGCEQISLQYDTLINGELVTHAPTTPVLDACHINDSYSFYIDSGELKGRYKDNLGVVTDLVIGSIQGGLISVNDSNGIPTFYTDLQTAINATADVDTVYIHSDIELTSVVTLPQRSSLTINLQGHRIWGDTTGGDFNLFTLASSSSDRTYHFTGAGVIETIGTAVNNAFAAPFYVVSVGAGKISMFFNDTKVKSVNATAFYSNGINHFEGGYFYSTNSNFFINGINSYIQNVFVDTYETSGLGWNVQNCILKTRYGGFLFANGSVVSGCYIYGTVTKAGNVGLAYLYQGTHFYNNYLECDASSTRDALYVRGSSGSNGRVENNTAINRGTGFAGQWVYGNGYNNYCYAENNQAINVGNNCYKFVGNTAITNSTTSAAMVCYGTLIQGNTAINLNASNTNVALIVGRTNATTSEIYNNKAEVANAAVYNMKLTSTGTLYVANNVMGLIGLGLDLNTNTNAMTNTPDAYGNIKLG